MSYETKEFYFVVRETDEQMAILCEPMTEKLTALSNSELLLELRSGIDFEEAQKIAEYLNEMIKGISVLTDSKKLI